MKIAVLGAGISGTTSAYALTDKGHEVTLIDRERYAGMDTSFANGGQLSACNAETWHHPSTILKGMKWLFKKDAPLKLSLTPSWHKYSWETHHARYGGRCSLQQRSHHPLPDR